MNGFGSTGEGIIPFFRRLQLSGVPLDQCLLQAKLMGAGAVDLRGLVRGERCGKPAAVDEVMALGLAMAVADDWEVLLPDAHAYERVLRHFLVARISYSSGEAAFVNSGIFGNPGFEPQRRALLHRLGYPLADGRADEIGVFRVDPHKAPEWLDRGNPVMGTQVELDHFVSKAKSWGEIEAVELRLRNGQGPGVISVAAGPVRRLNELPCGWVRVIGVSGVEVLQLRDPLEALVVVDCPSLTHIEGRAVAFVAKNCPRLERLSLPTTEHLHLSWESDADYLAEFRPGFLLLEACKGLRVLPHVMSVQGDMKLKQMPPFLRWPGSFRVEGNLTIEDCPDIDRLPPIEIGGSLRVKGASGLRCLAEGTVVGGDLDLRACAGLVVAPKGVTVGGCTLLPGHLRTRIPRNNGGR